MSKCARKLAPRWGALITFGYLLILGLVRLVQGKMPATDTVQWTYQSGTVNLPYVLPRLADVAVVFVASTIATWLTIDMDRSELAELFGFDDQSDFQMAKYCATVLGVLGAGFAVFGGVWWAFGGAVFAAVIFMVCYLKNWHNNVSKPKEWEKNMNRGLVMAHWWGGVVMFFVATPFAGLLASATYALFTLAVIISIELVVAGAIGISIGTFRIVKSPFKRTFLACDVEGDCAETSIIQS